MRLPLLAVALTAAGCLATEPATSLVPAGLSPPADPAVHSRVSYAPANVEAAARVDTLGRKLVGCNKIGLKPVFRTIGSPQPEIFHIGQAEVDVTEGLVNQCKTEGELAAALCTELGKMVSEREAVAGPQARRPNREPPQEVRIGNDNAGAFGPADQTHLAELARFDKDKRGPAAPPPPPPDPQALARLYLKQAGYAENDLDAVQPTLRAAAENSTFEKQFTGTMTSRPWVR